MVVPRRFVTIVVDYRRVLTETLAECMESNTYATSRVKLSFGVCNF